MSRYDKYDPISGGLRAILAADWAAADGTPVGVGLDATGKVVPGAGTTGVLGVCVVVVGTNGLPAKAGDVVDIMTHGEILEVGDTGFTGRAAGIPVYVVPGTGALTNVATANIKVGYMAESDRLVVRKGASSGTAA